MASTAPDLTWAITSYQAPTSSSSISDVISACNAAITASTWVIQASAADYILISPPVGSSVSDLRILIAGDSSGPNAANMLSPHTTQTNTVYFGLAPESGKNSLTNAWNSASNPFDTDRWSEYAKAGDSTSSVNVDGVFAIYSEEVFGLFFKTAFSDDIRGFITGAIIDPPFDADGEGTPGRVYGLSTSGESAMSNAFIANSGDFLGTTGGQNAISKVFDPDSTSVLIDVDKIPVTPPSTGRMLTSNGNTIFQEIVAIKEDSPFHLLGVYRQISWWQDGRVRNIVQDSGSATKGILIGAQEASDSDVAVFFNKS